MRRLFLIPSMLIALGGLVAMLHRAVDRHCSMQAGGVRAAAFIVARNDERAAANASAAISAGVAQQTIASAAVTHYIIEDLHHAIDIVPPAAPGAALPAAPVDSLRDDLNKGIAGANRAADAADTLP